VDGTVARGVTDRDGYFAFGLGQLGPEPIMLRAWASGHRSPRLYLPGWREKSI